MLELIDIVLINERVLYVLDVSVLVHQHKEHLELLVWDVVSFDVKELQVFVSVMAQCRADVQETLSADAAVSQNEALDSHILLDHLCNVSCSFVADVVTGQVEGLEGGVVPNHLRDSLDVDVCIDQVELFDVVMVLMSANHSLGDFTVLLNLAILIELRLHQGLRFLVHLLFIHFEVLDVRVSRDGLGQLVLLMLLDLRLSDVDVLDLLGLGHEFGQEGQVIELHASKLELEALLAGVNGEGTDGTLRI